MQAGTYANDGGRQWNSCSRAKPFRVARDGQGRRSRSILDRYGTLEMRAGQPEAGGEFSAAARCRATAGIYERRSKGTFSRFGYDFAAPSQLGRGNPSKNENRRRNICNPTFHLFQNQVL